jgi:glycosyltransferase involved in cell wall biosynthesis
MLEEAPVTTLLEPIELPTLPDEPLVSVLVSNYNYARFVGRALESALHQTYERIEVVVCDDGSTDESCSMIERMAAQDDRVSLIRKDNGGQASAFNAAFAESKGHIVCFLDADDVWLPTKVEKCVRSLQVTNAGLLVHQLFVVDSDLRELQRIPTFTRFENGWIADRVLARGGRWRWMPTSAIVMRPEVLSSILPMPESPFRTEADTFILMLAPLMTEIQSIEEVLGLYRLHGANAFSAKQLDRQAVVKTINALSDGINEVNKRLSSRGMGTIRLSQSRNIKIAEQTFLRNAFDGSPRGQLAREYASLVRRLARDDLYSPIQKAWALVMFGLMIPMPKGLRGSWASANLGTSKVREFARKLRQLGLWSSKARQ